MDFFIDDASEASSVEIN